jgi:hypothetical protein
LTGIDPLTNHIVALFHSRRNDWHDHFTIIDLRIEGTSPSRRATVEVLEMNEGRRLALRGELQALGEFP